MPLDFSILRIIVTPAHTTFFFFLITAATFCQAQNKSIPEWARGAIWYEIYIDRFENGDSTNDLHRYPGLDEYSPWKVKAWTSNWYELSDEEKAHTTEFYPNAFLRSYGGDIQGIIKRLDYLAALGVEGILLSPVFEASSIHRFNINSFHHIDVSLGLQTQIDTISKNREVNDNPATWYFTPSDKFFLDLLNEAHKRGIKIVIDVVFNHVGNDFWAFKDVQKHQEKSKYADWFKITQWDNAETPAVNEFQYKGMWNQPGLPLIKQDSTGYPVGFTSYIYSITKRWMDPNNDGNPSDGIDGWRVYHCAELPALFVIDWMNYVKKINPNALVIAQTDIGAKCEKHFDTKLNYEFLNEVRSFLIDTNMTSPSQFDNHLGNSTNKDLSDFLINAVDTYETERLASMVLNRNLRWNNQESTSSNFHYVSSKLTSKERLLQKLIILFQFTYAGSPLIYYGDEAGIWGGCDPDCRKPMVWFDKKYDDENSFIVNSDTSRYSNAFDSAVYDFYKKLIELRKEHLSLRSGSMMTTILDDQKSIYGFKRKAGSDEVYIVVNASMTSQVIPVLWSGLSDGMRLDDPVNDVHFYYQKGGINVVIPSHSCLLLIPSR